MVRKLLAAAALGALMVQPALAADKIKIGVITTLTTPAAVIGKEQVNGFNLALEHLGGKMGGMEVELVIEDDGFKPEIGKQAADKLVKQENVDIVTGFIWSHVMLAASKSVLDSGKIMITPMPAPRRWPARNATRTSSRPPGRTTRSRWRSARS